MSSDPGSREGTSHHTDPDAGHVFVVHGDLTAFACDAWLLPTDASLYVTDPWWTQTLAPHLRAAFCRGHSHHGPIRPDAIGPERCRPLIPSGLAEPSTPLPCPWLTVMGAGRATLDWYLDGVRRFIAAALADLTGPTARPFLPRRVRRLLAVPLVGTGHGGAHRSAGAMAEALVALLYEEAARHRVDLVLVTNKRADFAAAQAARLRYGSDLWHALPPAIVARACTLAREAGAGQLVVILGAGVGAGAGLPLWDDLLAALAERAGLAREGVEWPHFQRLDALDKAEYLAARLRAGDGGAGGGMGDGSGDVIDASGDVIDTSGGVIDASSVAVDSSGRVIYASDLAIDISGRTIVTSGRAIDASSRASGRAADASGRAADASGRAIETTRATTRAPKPAATPTGVGPAVVELLARHQHAALAHALIAGLPTREAITTNYDRLYETACEATGRPCAVLPYAPRSEHRRWLLKMHGCVDHPDDIILTRENYLRYAERNAALAGIVQAMLITRSMLFVGFSLGDDNFLRIVDAVRRAIRPTGDRAAQLGTAVMLIDNPLLRTLWGADLDWICLGAAGEEGEAARRFEIFLDCLSLHAADTAHLLDPRFAPVRTEAEDALVRLLQPLRDAPADDPARKAPAWALVEALLERLGG